MGEILRNVMEDAVNKKLDEMMDDLGCCKCKYCRLDITAYALNRLPAKYVVTHKGRLISKLDIMEKQFDTDLVAVIAKGAEVVKEHPRHL